MPFSVILTGATGMVGEGVLLECVKDPAVARILVVGRRPYGLAHPKVKECVVPDFLDLEKVREELSGYDACFFCAGISSRGMSEAGYRRVTYDVTLHFARTLAGLNTGMVFDYVSGALTDSSERGRIMWARVKGKTENDLMALPFRRVYNFRPGFMEPVPGQKNLKSYYKAIAWLTPLLRLVMPGQMLTLREVSRAMVNSVAKEYPKHVLEIGDIRALGRM